MDDESSLRMVGGSRCASDPEAHLNIVTVRAGFFFLSTIQYKYRYNFLIIDGFRLSLTTTVMRKNRVVMIYVFHSRLRRHLRQHTGDSSNRLKKNLNACLSDRGKVVKTFKWEDRLQIQKGHLIGFPDGSSIG